MTPLRIMVCSTGLFGRKWLETGTRRAVLALLVGAGLIPWPRLAGGHAYLVRSTPAGRAVLYRSPERVRLWFNERLEPEFCHVEVTNARGEPVDLRDPRVGPDDPKALSVAVPELPPGSYTVRFRVLSVDGHVVDGRLLFTIMRSQ